MLGHLRDTGISIELIPTGLFSGAGARPMDKGFAAYAWSNDQRIARLTGQPFSETYKREVLEASGGLLDSGPATLALTAVSLAEADRELDALKAIQHARYVDGLDITAPASLAGILEKSGFGAAVERIAAAPDDDLVAANRVRTDRGRELLASFDAQGVPALLVDGRRGARLLGSAALFGSVDNLLSHLQAA
jgi:putative protein-disulfide isomerase